MLLTIGAGGELVELFADSVTLMLPTTASAALNAISGLRCAPLLRGHRGRASADLDAAAQAVLAIADFAAAHRQTLAELDVNPLAVRAQGEGAVALDALISMIPAQDAPEPAS